MTVAIGVVLIVVVLALCLLAYRKVSKRISSGKSIYRMGPFAGEYSRYTKNPTPRSRGPGHDEPKPPWADL